MKAFAGAGLVLALLGLAAPASAQSSTVVLAAPAPAAARAADVASVDAIVAALYEVVSGPAGKVRDWNRLRSLFTADGKMGAIGARKEGGFGLRAMTVDDYIARTSKPFSDKSTNCTGHSRPFCRSLVLASKAIRRKRRRSDACSVMVKPSVDEGIVALRHY